MTFSLMCRITAAMLVVCVVAFSFAVHAESKLPLYGTVVIIDPGHGGSDPGASGQFIEYGTQERVSVAEAPYVYDVAKRLVNRVRESGGIALITREDAKNRVVNTNPPNHVLPFLGNNDVYTGTRTRVNAAREGLDARLVRIQEAEKRFPKHRIVWVSIHFDSDEDPSIEGAYVIAPQGKSPAVAEKLVNAFRATHRIRHKGATEYLPLMTNADRSHGLRNLYVLRADKNLLSQRVLIELGNFASPNDVWRIRNPDIRAEYARIIANALAR